MTSDYVGAGSVCPGADEGYAACLMVSSAFAMFAIYFFEMCSMLGHVG